MSRNITFLNSNYFNKNVEVSVDINNHVLNKGNCLQWNWIRCRVPFAPFLALLMVLKFTMGSISKC